MNGLSFNQGDENQAATQCHHTPQGGTGAFAQDREYKAGQPESRSNQAEDGEESHLHGDGLARQPRQTDINHGVKQGVDLRHLLKPHSVTIAVLVLAALSANITNFLVYMGSYVGFLLLLTMVVVFDPNQRLPGRLRSETRRHVVDEIRHLMLGLYCLASLAAVFGHKPYYWLIVGVEGVLAAFACARYDLGVWLRRRTARSEGGAA